MSRHLKEGLVLLTLVSAAACSDTTAPTPVSLSPAFASGSAGGTSTGGGGGGGSVKRCAILSLTVFNDVVNSLAIPSFWQSGNAYVAQVSGSTEKSCDAIGNATIQFEDISDASPECAPALTPWVNNPNYVNPKYGAKPMSRFREGFIYYTGQSCIGSSRTLRATLTDPSPGGKVSSVTMTWVP